MNRLLQINLTIRFVYSKRTDIKIIESTFVEVDTWCKEVIFNFQWVRLKAGMMNNIFMNAVLLVTERVL